MIAKVVDIFINEEAFGEIILEGPVFTQKLFFHTYPPNVMSLEGEQVSVDDDVIKWKGEKVADIEGHFIRWVSFGEFTAIAKKRKLDKEMVFLILWTLVVIIMAIAVAWVLR